MTTPAFVSYLDVELSQGCYYDILPAEDGKYHVFMVVQIGPYFTQYEIAVFDDAEQTARFSANILESWRRVCKMKS